MLHPLRLLRRRGSARADGFVACTECGTEVPAELAFRQGDVIACSVLCLADAAVRRGGYLRD